MSAKDISRFLFQPQKRYSSVRMQQGRVILDSDWNESERIDDEEARRILAETVCAKGTPNEGFLVQELTEATVTVPPAPPKETYDFALGSGSFYLGGLRFEVVSEIAERFLSQIDWLQIDADLGNLPARPSLADLTNADGSFKVRHDLVYLHGWEQPVTAVEDSELRERALGGPDTSVRMRRMRRIEVLPEVDLDLTSENFCAQASARLKVHLTAPRQGDGTGEPHFFDDANSELRSKARLTVTFGGQGITEDPCKPAVTAGFLGAENQTIRVQLTATNRFIWGDYNASPLYRVQVLEEAGRPVKIKFLTQPRDQTAQPIKPQAVEILPWGAFLPNQEKVAELQGHLATVVTSFDPEEKTITVSKPVPQAWIDWLNAPAHEKYLSDRDPDDKKKYFYLRLWTGGSGDAEEPDHAFTPGTPVELSGTGLNVTFSQPGLPGDFWIIAARPNTPDVVVPWELMEQASPAGTRFFFAPLALIFWRVDPEFPPTVKSQVLDCRHKFRPLCEVDEGLKVSTGIVIFQEVEAGKVRESPPIAHGLDVNYVAIVMAHEFVFQETLPNFVDMGDVDVLPSSFQPYPLLAARYDPNDLSRRFSIFLSDRRESGSPRIWLVRWWAIPKTLDQPNVTVSPPSPGGPIINVDETPVPFGDVIVGKTEDEDIVVRNVGTAELNVTSIDSSNPRFRAFPGAFTLAAGGDIDVKVVFAPTSGGPQTATLTINSNDPKNPPSVPLQGFGVVAVPDIVVPDTPLEFGTVQLGQETTGGFVVGNRGNAPLRVLSIAGGFPSFRDVSPTAFTVAADGLQNVSVTFRPTAVGLQTGTLTINSDNPDGPVSVSLRGRGTLGPPPQQ